MTNVLRLLSVAMVLIAAIGMGWSYPTLYGDTGLILVPTADTIPDTYVALAVNYVTAETAAGDATLLPARLLYGASDNNELFVLLAESHNETSSGGFDVKGGGLKIALMKEDLFTNSPGVAVGARLFQKQGWIDQRTLEAYVVGSKVLFKKTDVVDEQGYTFRGHLGLFFTRFTGNLGEGTPDGLEENFWSLAGGVSYHNFNGTSVAIDFVPKLKSDFPDRPFRDSELSFALRRPLSREFFIEIGATQPFNQGNGGSLYAGLLYQWGIREVPINKRPRIEGANY